VIQAYQTEKITHAEVVHILGLPSRWTVDDFLKQHHADLHYDETDLERDRTTLQQLRAKPTSSTL
jgi:predicted HTH domain antitoxin